MNIAIITILLPYPLNSGGAQAQYNMIDTLRFKHRFTLIFPENGNNSMAAMKVLQQRWPEVEFRPYRYVRQLAYLPFFFDKVRRAFGMTFQKNNPHFQAARILKPYGYPINKNFIRFVRQIIENESIDIVQTEFYPYLPLAKILPNNVKKIFIHHEIRFVRNVRLSKNIQLDEKEKTLLQTLKDKELSDLEKYDCVVTLTETDKQILEETGVKTPIFVSPAAISTQMLPYKGWNGKIVFIGGYNHTPNQEGMEWFLHQVVPNMPKEIAEKTELNIIGMGWPQKWEKEDNLLKVKYLGFVPDLAEAAHGAIMIVPILSGSGMRMKILEAAALGMPILTTSVGVEGLHFVHEESCLIADTPKDYAQALRRLITDEGLRERLTENSAQTFEAQYSTSALAHRREQIYLTNKSNKNEL